MKIGHKIGAGYAAVLGLTLLIGIVGLWTSRLMGKQVEFLAGPAWSTADGAMEAVIGVRGQMLATQQIIGGQSTPAVVADLEHSRELTVESVEKVQSAGQLSRAQAESLNDNLAVYERVSGQLLAAYEALADARRRFGAHNATLVEVGEIAEAIGDGGVERLESEPDRAMAWNDGLSELWAAADGGMESSIGHLMSLYQLSRLSAGEATSVIRPALEEALAFHEEAAGEMLSTPAFDVPLEHPAFSGRTVAAVYRDLLADHRKLVMEIVARTEEFRRVEQEYVAHGEKLTAFMDDLEASGDEAVEASQVEAIDTQVLSGAMILGSTAGAAALGAACLVSMFFWVVRPLRRVVDRVRDVAQGDGDLTQRVQVRGSDEFGELASAVNHLLDHIRGIIVEVRRSADVVAEEAGTAAGGAGRISETLEAQAARATRLAVAGQELAANAEQVAVRAGEAAEVATKSGATAMEKSATVHATIDGIETLRRSLTESSSKMSGLAVSADRISAVMHVINDIADQTNLLALNAAIEAARAGEHGRGFAVVADEVRKLAERTAASTEEVGSLVREIQTHTTVVAADIAGSVESVESSVGHARDAGAGLAGIVQTSGLTASIISEISGATSEQSGVIQELVRELGELTVAADASLSDATACQATTSKLSNAATQLRELVQHFRIA